MKFIISLWICLLSLTSMLEASDADCQYYVGEHQIPRLKASSTKNLWACIGYVHGYYRGYQMEFFRRATQGKLAEVYGFSKLKTDIFLRLLKLPTLAGRLLKELEPSALETLDAYSLGVNRALQEPHPTQVSKFRHYDLTPSPWTTLDSLSVLLLQSFFQTKRGFEMEIRAEELQAHLDIKDIAEYRNDLDRPWATTVIKPSELPQAANIAPTEQHTHLHRLKLSEETFAELLDLFDVPELRFHGSNNFVIGPQRSKSGHAILGNDPHLEIHDPQYFFWMSLEVPGTKILAASVPGIPGFPLGMNEQMAWGLTNSFFDASDLVVVNETALKLRSERPTIYIKFGPLQLPFFFKSLSWTDEENSRPILPLDADRLEGDQKLLLEWTGYKMRGQSISALFDLPFSTSVQNFDKNLQRTELPSWHFVFADTKGNIGFRTSGLLLKLRGMNSFGFKDDRRAFDEFLTALEAPTLSNPSRGYIVTANNHPWPADYSYSAGNTFEPGFRAHRIEELIEKERVIWDLETAKALQCDVKATDADYLKPLLIHHLTGKDPMLMMTSEERQILAKLEQAQPLVFDLDCKECALYTLWVEKLRDEMKMDETNLYYWLTSKTTDYPKLRKKVVETFRDAVDELQNSVGLYPRWGDVHRNSFLQIGETSRDRKFSIEAPGAYHSVSLGQSYWQKDEEFFQMTYAPATRFLAELSSPPKALFVLPAENIREDESSLFREDPMSKAWSSCQYVPVGLGFDTKLGAKTLRSLNFGPQKDQ